MGNQLESFCATCNAILDDENELDYGKNMQQHTIEVNEQVLETPYKSEYNKPFQQLGNSPEVKNCDVSLIDHDYAMREIPSNFGNTEHTSMETSPHSLIKQSNYEKDREKIKDLKYSSVKQAIITQCGEFELKYDEGPVLGSGTFGNVVKCSLKGANNFEFACKKMLKKEYKTLMMQSFLKNEIHLLKTKTQHPYLSRIYDFYQNKEYYLMVSEFAQGGDLWQQIYNKKGFTENMIIIIVRQMLQALKFLHEQNIVHRDIKCQNVLLETPISACENELQVVSKICDFGLAAYCDPVKGMTELSGTKEYMAPEIEKKGGFQNNRVDIWALGVVVFRIFHHAFPFGNPGQNTHAGPKYRKDINPLAIDFMKQCFIADVKRRPHAGQLLQHAWLKQKQTRMSKMTLEMKNKYNDMKKNLVANVMARAAQPESYYQYSFKLLKTLTWVQVTRDETLHATTIFQLFDHDLNGYINSNEFIDGMNKLIQESGVTPCDPKALAQVFFSIDQKRTNQVDFQEFLTLCLNMETLVQSGGVEKLFKMYDKQGNGRIPKVFLEETFDDDEDFVFNMLDNIQIDRHHSVAFQDFHNHLSSQAKRINPHRASRIQKK